MLWLSASTPQGTTSEAMTPRTCAIRRASIAILIAAMPAKGKTVLEVGSGPGRNLRQLQEAALSVGGSARHFPGYGRTRS